MQLLCRTHELEIAKVEMESKALLQQHEVKRRDLLLLKYDRQRNLMNEIIKRQKALIEGIQFLVLISGLFSLLVLAVRTLLL